MTPARLTNSTIVSALLAATTGMVATAVAILVVTGAAAPPPAHRPSDYPPARLTPTAILAPLTAGQDEATRTGRRGTTAEDTGACAPPSDNETPTEPSDADGTTKGRSPTSAVQHADGQGCRLPGSNH